MAKVEMDISEYEEMKKNARLLKEALEDNKESQRKIEALKEEQLQTLKNNEKVVTIINETRTEEVVLYRKEPYEIWSALRIPPPSGRGRREFSENEWGWGQGPSNPDWIVDVFFDKRILTTEPTQTVTTKGLEQVTAEIRRDIKKELTEAQTEEYRLNILRVKFLEKEIKEVKLSEVEKTIDLNKAEADLLQLTEENNSWEEMIEFLDEEVKTLALIKQTLKENSSNMFKSTLLLKKIKSLVGN